MPASKHQLYYEQHHNLHHRRRGYSGYLFPNRETGDSLGDQGGDRRCDSGRVARYRRFLVVDQQAGPKAQAQAHAHSATLFRARQTVLCAVNRVDHGEK